MTSGLREELRREAGAARTYDVYARSLVTARRTRRRTALAWVILVAALTAAVPFAAGPRVIAPTGGVGPSLPDRLGLPAFGSLTVTDRPHLDAASVVFTGYGGRFGPFFDDATRLGLVGADADRYRTVQVGIVDDGVLLSPDGRVVAIPDRLVDVPTGASRPMPDGGGVPVAWSPDGRRLVLTTGLRLRIADLGGGPAIDLGGTDDETSAAWSPDGQRLAYESDHRIVIADDAGRRLSSFAAPAGSILAGKAAWTRDGHAVALVERAARVWSPRWFDPATGREVSGPDLPGVVGRITLGRLLGWRPDGSALLFVRGDPVPDQPSTATPPRLLALAPGAAAPTRAMSVPNAVTDLDLADRSIATGRVRPGDPPFFIGPRLWPWLLGGGLVALVLGLTLRRRRDRLRWRRVAAVPWETTHGPL